MDADISRSPEDPIAGRAVTLQKILERDFPAIERGINEFLALHGGSTAATVGLRRSIEALRRHIYVEQEFVFPPLRSAGREGPVIAMSSDHADLWRTMDELETFLADHKSPKAQQQTCQILMAELDRHLSREDPIVFRHVVEVLTPQDEATLRDEVEHAVLPPDWVCPGAQDD